MFRLLNIEIEVKQSGKLLMASRNGPSYIAITILIVPSGIIRV